MTIKVLHNQTLFDLSIYLFGTASESMSLAIANNISLTDDLKAGQILSVPGYSNFGQRLISDYFQKNKLKPATGLTVSGKLLEMPEGIDYWAVSVDFEVQ